MERGERQREETGLARVQTVPDWSKVHIHVEGKQKNDMGEKDTNP